MLERYVQWTYYCWLGVCLWLLAGEGGCASAEPCRNAPCSSSSSEAEHQLSRQQCQGPRCLDRINRPSHAFVHPPTPTRGQLQSKEQFPARPQQPQTSGESSSGQAALAPRGARENCSRGGDCIARTSNGTTIQDCKGIECRLPLRIRQKPRLAIQSIPCPPNQGEGCPEPTLIRVTEKAAQFIGEELAYTPPELGGATLGVQLTCDVKPGR